MKEQLNRMEQQWWNFLNKKFLKGILIGWVFFTCLYILNQLTGGSP